jgi:hypothetical protein
LAAADLHNSALIAGDDPGFFCNDAREGCQFISDIRGFDHKALRLARDWIVIGLLLGA